MNSEETHGITRDTQATRSTPPDAEIHYEPGLICTKNGEFVRTFDFEEFNASKIPYCRCEGYCLKEPITWISIIGIIVIILLICRYIKKHKKK